MIKKIQSAVLVLCIIATLIPENLVEINAAEIIYSGVSGDLEWNIDREGTLTITGEGDYELRETNQHRPEWCDYENDIVSAKVDVRGITSTNSMFEGCDNLTNLDLSSFDTENVTDMRTMFYQCNSLESLDLSHLKTSHVTDMSSMFFECSNLKSLDVSNFDTGSVTDMAFMFAGCEHLTSLDLYSFHTENVEDMSAVFNECSNLTELDLENFNTGNVVYMGSMFAGCGNLKKLNLGSFNTGNVLIMGYMFENCGSLESLDLQKFDMAKVINIENWFYGCGDLVKINTPLNLSVECGLPEGIWKDEQGKTYSVLPLNENLSLSLKKEEAEKETTEHQSTEAITNPITEQQTTKRTEEITSKNQNTSLTLQGGVQNTNPSKVSKLKAKNVKGRKVKLTWKKAKNAYGYQIVYAINKKFKKNKKTANVAKASTISKKVGKLKVRKTYYFKIRAYIKADGKKVYGAWSKVTKVKIKK